MNYPINCQKCNKPLYGHVKYCPFCGTASISAAARIGGGGTDTGITKPVEEIITKQPEPTVIESETTKEAEPEKVISEVKTPTKDLEIIESSAKIPRKKPFLKIAIVVGIVAVIAAGLLNTQKGTVAPPVPKTNRIETKTKPVVARPKETKKEAVEPSKSQLEQRANQQPVAAPNLNEERAKIRQEVEKEALAKAETERQRQEQLSRQKEIANQRQEHDVKQGEIDAYLSDGKNFFENGKYELCIEKMREVVRRDNNNREAKQFIRMASEKINNIKQQFSNPTFGGSE